MRPSTSVKNTTVKQVTVLARVEFKCDPRRVVYRCLSSNGKDTYNTFLFNGKATSCECPATKPRYHMVQCEAREAARNTVDAAAADATYQGIKKMQTERENAAAYMRMMYNSYDLI